MPIFRYLFKGSPDPNHFEINVGNGRIRLFPTVSKIKSVLTGIPLNESFFTFFVWYRWIYFGCYISLLFQENSLKIFFFKKSMFVAFLYIALILGFSQSIVSRAWGDRFRPLVHPLESEVGPHRGPLHQPQDHSRVEKKVLTSSNQPPKSYFTKSLILALIV